MALPNAGPSDCSSGLSARIFNNLRYDNPWQALQGGVAVGAVCCPTTPNGIGYRCTAITTGITGGGEPTWPLVLTNTVVDGGVTWTAQDVANPTGRVHTPAGFFGYVATAADLDAYRVFAYNTAKALCDELAADNEAWVAATLTNSWVAFGAGTAPSYKRYLDGTVKLRGAMKNGSALNTAAFTLPVGFRPASGGSFVVRSFNAVPTDIYAVVTVDTGGVVTVGANNTGSTNFIAVDGITFDTV